MKNSSLTVLGTIALVLIATLIAKSILTDGVTVVMTPLAYMLAGFGLGMAAAYVRNRLQRRSWQWLWLLIVLLLLFSIAWIFEIPWSLENPNPRHFTSFFLSAYLLTSALTRRPQAAPNTSSLRDDTRAAILRGGTDGFLLGGVCGVIVFLLIYILNLKHGGPAQLIWVVILPAMLGAGIGAWKNRDYAAKRRAAIERNPELAALFYRLGDGLRYDSGTCQAMFQSRHSAEVFRQAAPDWQVRHTEK